jgi:hypothetical protein
LVRRRWLRLRRELSTDQVRSKISHNFLSLRDFSERLLHVARGRASKRWLTLIRDRLRHFPNQQSIMQKSRPRIFALLIDLSGTLHIGDVPTPSAPNAVQRLREARVPFRFCSNTSKESKKDLCHGLKKMGFTLEPDQAEVWTSLGAVKESLKRRGSKRSTSLRSVSFVYSSLRSIDQTLFLTISISARRNS